MEKGFSKKPSRIISPDFYQLVIFGTTGAVNALTTYFSIGYNAGKNIFSKVLDNFNVKKASC